MNQDAPGGAAIRVETRLPGDASGPLGGPGTALGQGRFVLKGVLGSGTSGVVYEAHDRVRDAAVALKTLHRLDPQSIYHLKREFRALADLSHPNLVPLHELVCDDGRWFFTMELIDGVDFLSYVRGGDQPPRVGEPFRPDFHRLRDAFRQLAAGVQALHRSRKLHRDIKPSNARVTAEGRVVLLDFGLVVAAEDPYRTADAGPVGTPAYLAPEQARSVAAISPASDWYAVGVLLYEALTGALPFDGTILQILKAKQAGEPPPPSTLVPWVPPDLDRLCVGLLRQDAEARPSGRDVLRALENTGLPTPTTELSDRTVSAAAASGEVQTVLLGRERELETLREAFVACKRGKTLSVFIHGESGTGKTALLDHFLNQLRDERDAVVISGRCVERELVPYRALDSLVDGLTRYLMSLSMREAEAVLPRDISVLARLFPVLRRVPAVGGGLRRDEVELEPQELRSRAFAALRDLAGRIADRRPLVLAIDDLQWGDVDSAHLIRYVMRPPNPPPLLAVACYRTGDPSRSACLQALFEPAAPGLRSSNELREIALGPLGGEDSRRLAQSLFAQNLPVSEAAATRVARESAGNPFFIHQLAQFLNSGAGGASVSATVEADARGIVPAGEGAADVSLEQVLALRVAELPEGARRLLEVLALAGVPLEPELANVVADLAPAELSALTTLRANRMVRPHNDERTFELTHDRLRQAVLKTIAGEARAPLHGRLARAFEARPNIDPEILASHFEGAGDSPRASAYAAVAARRAEQALAFERAVRMARWALELGPARPEEVRSLQTQLGKALANMGNAAEAADAYLQACPGAGETEALELRRRAAEQLLKSGHIDRAMSILEEVLRSVGLRLARTPRKAWFSLARRRLWLGLRGLSFRERDSTHISEHDRTKLDVLWSLAAGLGIVDSIRAADFQARHLILALRLGDAYRVGRALTFEASFSAIAGPRARKRTAKLVRKSEEIAARLDIPDSRAWALLASGMAAFLQGDHRDSLSLCERAETIFRSACVGVAWEVNCARLFSVFSLYYRGEIGELGRRVPAMLAEAEQHGDLYLATCLRTGLPNLAWLAADEPQEARAQVNEGMRHWSKHGFHNQHYFNMSAEAHIDLYLGDPESARARVLRDWPQLKSSLILRIQAIRQLVIGLRARATLALAARDTPQRRPGLLAEVERDARRLHGETISWAPPQAALLRAGIAHLRGHAEVAKQLLTEAAAGFAAADMRLFHVVATRALGGLRGGPEGEQAISRADAWMTEQSIRSPARFAAVFAPGFEVVA